MNGGSLQNNNVDYGVHVFKDFNAKIDNNKANEIESTDNTRGKYRHHMDLFPNVITNNRLDEDIMVDYSFNITFTNNTGAHARAAKHRLSRPVHPAGRGRLDMAMLLFTCCAAALTWPPPPCSV